jgi:hypothetical protein
MINKEVESLSDGPNLWGWSRLPTKIRHRSDLYVSAAIICDQYTILSGKDAPPFPRCDRR